MERERRFLVRDERWPEPAPPYSRTIEDLYLDCGRLRLRRMVDADSGCVIYKLSKKYGPESPGIEPIVTTMLSEQEYAALAVLSGRRLAKTRHYDDTSGRIFGIDVFAGELEGLVLCETEADSEVELRAIVPPDYAGTEVTADPFFTGGSLSRARRDELLAKLGRQ